MWVPAKWVVEGRRRSRRGGEGWRREWTVAEEGTCGVEELTDFISVSKRSFSDRVVFLKGRLPASNLFRRLLKTFLSLLCCRLPSSFPLSCLIKYCENCWVFVPGQLSEDKSVHFIHCSFYLLIPSWRKFKCVVFLYIYLHITEGTFSEQQQS